MTIRWTWRTQRRDELCPPTGAVDVEAEQRRLQREQKYEKLTKGMSLSVCYAASIGGTATLTGTTPNVILMGQMNEYDCAVNTNMKTMTLRLVPRSRYLVISIKLNLSRSFFYVSYRR